MSVDAVLGMNRRNAHIARVNERDALRVVDDKLETKVRLRSVGVPVSPTLAHVTSPRDARDLLADGLTSRWACKPNRSRRGLGILLAGGRHPRGGWRSLGGDQISRGDVLRHLRRILDGEFSRGGSDTAVFEPLLVPHPAIASLAPAGLPDVRVICDGSHPVAAMLRLPTERSDGRANLHAGGVGAAVDVDTGRIVSALVDRSPVEHHPDTGRRLVGVTVPHWDEVLAASRRCSAATGLDYVGADVVIDDLRGPLVLEVNGRPGLEIQNVLGRGLRAALAGGRTDARRLVRG